MSKQRRIEGLPKEQDNKERNGNYYLLAIGIDEYMEFPRLNNAVRDAKAIVQVLQERYSFKANRTYTFFNNEATKQNIYRIFEKLVREIDKEDNLLIYFSGHGYYSESLKQGYWIPVDAKPNSTVDYFANSEIVNFIRSIKSLHTFLIADACFSGSLFSQHKSVTNEFTVRVMNLRSRWGLTSGRNEIVEDGPLGRFSPFAHVLIEYLNKNNSALVRVSELIQSVQINTANNASQTPLGNRIRNTHDAGGEFVFKLKEGTSSLESVNNILDHYSPLLPESEVDPRKKMKKVLYLVGTLLIIICSAWVGIQWSKKKDIQNVENSIEHETFTHEFIDSIYNLGKQAFTNGKYQEAFSLFDQSSDLGLPQAKYRLGMMFIQGNGVNQNLELGIKHLKAAAMLKDSEAACTLGLLYYDNQKGIEKDIEEAKRWLEFCEKLGDHESVKTAKALLINLE